MGYATDYLIVDGLEVLDFSSGEIVAAYVA